MKTSVGTRWRHNKRQTEYEVVAEVFAAGKLPDNCEAVFYAAKSKVRGGGCMLGLASKALFEEYWHDPKRRFEMALPAVVQISEPRLVDPLTVFRVYRALDGHGPFWARPEGEFGIEAGRFTRILGETV